MTWRALSEDEDEQVIDSMLALYEEDPASSPMTRAKALGTLRRLRAEPLRGVAIGAAGDGGLCGYALLCSFWSNELGGEVCSIDELFVAPAARGQGRASELVQGLCARRWPWFRDAVAIELEVTPANGGARSLYERLGFRPYENALMRALPAPP